MNDKGDQNQNGRNMAAALAAAIHAHAAELSAIDGAIGDGDHGVNLDKGFTAAMNHLAPGPVSISDALRTIGDTLLRDVGGAMGPLYGTFFAEMAEGCVGVKRIDGATFERMLDRSVAAVLDLGGAQVGDKTLVDVLVPARDAFRASLMDGGQFDQALEQMAKAADLGRDATRDLVAKVGRASRLGERSRGVLDAGATSCALILTVLAASLSAPRTGAGD